MGKDELIEACKNCGEEKPHYAFGLCKGCYDIQYRQLNRDRWLAYRRNYYDLNKKKHLAQAKKYRQKNKDKVVAQRKKYRTLNKEKLVAKRKDYRQNGKVNGIKIITNGNKQYWAYNTGRLVHVAIAEKALGRKFKPGEGTHHIDGNGLNNRHSNLLIYTGGYHTMLHWRMGDMG